MSYPSARSWLGATYFRLLTWISPRRKSHGLPVWAPLSTREERWLISERLNEALNLLSKHAPARHTRVVRSLKGFLILGTQSITASYDPANAVCRLGENFMAAPDTTATAVACAVVHEATHGWLFKLGIPYDEPIRYRVEMVCIKAALLAAQRLPGGEAEVERCRAQMLIDPAFFSNDMFIERGISHLRELGCPKWLIRTVVWIGRRRAGIRENGN